MFKTTADTRALVADPSVHMAELVAGMLRTLKSRLVDVTHTPADTQRALASRSYRLMLVDAGMCSDQEFLLLRELRQAEQNPNRHLPIIMMAAAPSAALIAAARDAGVTEFLRKPFSAQHIQLRLDAIKSSPRPFVAAETYAGPDRRRRVIAGAPSRRAADHGGSTG